MMVWIVEPEQHTIPLMREFGLLVELKGIFERLMAAQYLVVAALGHLVEELEIQQASSTWTLY